MNKNNGFVSAVNLESRFPRSPNNIAIKANRFDQSLPATIKNEFIGVFPFLANCSEKRVVEFIAGRVTAQESLQAIGCKYSSSVRMSTDRSPVWPQGFVGSISHTNNIALAATADAKSCINLGIDVESIVDDKTAREIVSSIINATEIQRLETHFASFATIVSLAFSVKEALFKGLYPIASTFKDFSAAEISNVDIDNGIISLQLTEDWHARLSAGMIFECFFSIFDSEVYTLFYQIK